MQKLIPVSLLFIAGLALPPLVQAQTIALAQPIAHVPAAHLQDQYASLQSILAQVQDYHGVFLNYRTNLITSQKVAIKGFDLKDQDLNHLLQEILQPFGLDFAKVKEKYYVIYKQGSELSVKPIKQSALSTMSALAPPLQGAGIPPKTMLRLVRERMEKTITGRVTDVADDTGLPGVNIVAKGTSVGTVTDIDGNYQVAVPDEANILVFSSVGYEREEVIIGDQSVINVALAPDIQSLQEVVVVAYGEKSKKLMTESIGTIEERDIQQLPVASADAAIQGRVSGVQITSVDGSPGSPVAVRVRGVGTVGNTQPLYVIDGIPLGNPSGDGNSGGSNPLSTINPADIESISVLKDASASALYGVRAANGVVLITTKRGKTGQPRVSLDTYYGVQNFPSNRLFDWNTTDQYVALAREMYVNRNAQFALGPDDEGFLFLNPALEDGSELRSVNTDWQSEAIRDNAPISNYNLSIGGGTEFVNYNISGGYFKQGAVIPKFDLERFSFRANSDFKIKEWLRFGENFAVSHQEIDKGNNGGGQGFILPESANMPPFFSIYDRNNEIAGNRYGYNGNRTPSGAGIAGITNANALGLNAIYDKLFRTTRILGGIYGEIDIIPDLTFRSAASIDFTYQRNDQWNPAYNVREMGLDRISEFVDGRSERYTQVFTNTLNYTRELGNHQIDALLGIELTRIRNSSLSYRGSNFLSSDPDFYRSVSNGQGIDGDFANASSGLGNQTFLGYLARLSYNFQNKYLLTASFRRDGTSGFAPGLRYGNFPAFSAAWRVSEESFFDVPFISELKIRGSWGQLGNANTSSFAFVQAVTTTPDYGLGNPNITVQAPSPQPGVIPNQQVTWETVETTDFGVDMSLFDDKVSLLATYYFRNTRDFLFGLPVPRVAGNTPASVGGPSTDPPRIDVNLGQVTNQGLELELGYNTTIGQDLTLGVSGNLTTVRNRLAELAPGIQEFSSGNYRTAVGYPIGYFYGYKASGVYQTAQAAEAATPDRTTSNNPQAGDLIFENNNGLASEEQQALGQQFTGAPDSVIDASDRTYLGKTIPDFYYGLSLNATFKGLDLSILFQGVGGVQLYNEYRAENENLAEVGRNMLATTQDRWTGEGTSNTMPRAVAGDPYGNNRFSSRWIEDAGFLRLRNVQLGYSLPSSLLERTNAFSSVRIYVAASNLFVLTEYTGLDPEVMSVGASDQQTAAGTDVANIPQPRTFQAGLQVKF